MRHILLFALMLLSVANSTTLLAQCAPAPRVGGTTFAYGVMDSVTPAQVHPPQPYIVCDNASLYYFGNDPDTIYLEGSAQLKVGSSFNLVVYLRNNCSLRLDLVQSATKHFNKIVYDPTFTSFIDTAGIVVVNGFTACTGMAYSYAAFPNGNSPCAQATGTAAIAPQSAWTVWPNPARDWLEVTTGARVPKGTKAELFSMDGRMVREQAVAEGQRIAVGDLPRGFYTLRLVGPDFNRSLPVSLW
jgi:hypothetical protein